MYGKSVGRTCRTGQKIHLFTHSLPWHAIKAGVHGLATEVVVYGLATEVMVYGLATEVVVYGLALTIQADMHLHIFKSYLRTVELMMVISVGNNCHAACLKQYSES